jgi:tRNA-dihydrouridine synthase A
MRSGTSPATVDRRLSVAPMMERTDRHFRYLLRLLAPRTLLYTEMITAPAIVRGDGARLLEFDALEHPVALQLGGSDPAELAEAAAAGAARGYDEINLNVGCPSTRVQSGRFGVCLMREPDLVADCVRAMRAAVAVPVTVKTRIGVDEDDDYAFLVRFVETVAAAGCATFIVHARKAWLHGVSPKENRTLPPLRYDRVGRLKADFPELEIVVNGGIASAEVALAQLAQVDGVMVGREAYRHPYFIAGLDRLVYGGAPPPSRAEAVRAYLAHVRAERARGTPAAALVRHLHGLYHGEPGATAWRRALSPGPATAGEDAERIIERALAAAEAHGLGGGGRRPKSTAAEAAR